MADETIHDIVREMRVCQMAISHACAIQDEGWRHQIVRWRRVLADQLGRASSLLVAGGQPTMVRSALSALRAALADHQASWPAVSLDPDLPDYRRSVARVRAAFDQLEAVLALPDGSGGTRS